MTEEQRMQNMLPPTGPVDAVLDTDAYNEIDDQFALSYLLHCGEKVRLRAICAAPFLNGHSTSPEDGMVKSAAEIRNLLTLAGRGELLPEVFEGSRGYLPDERTPVDSPAARRLVALGAEYSPARPLYVVAIGAITNVASALLMEPALAENIVIVWLGGHATHWPNTAEFNMQQDVAAARVVFGCGAPLVQLPCCGVVDHFTVSGVELEHWLRGKNSLADYLCTHTVDEVKEYAAGTAWTRVIWDMTAAAWLMNDENRFMQSRLIPAPIPEYDHHYGYDPDRPLIRYVTDIHRDALATDMFRRLGGAE